MDITNTLSSSSSAPINVSTALVRAQEQFILAQQIHNNLTNQLSNNINSPELEIETPTGGTGGTTGPDEPGGQVNSPKQETETPKDTMRSQNLSESVSNLTELTKNQVNL